jgi:hypothetical protein
MELLRIKQAEKEKREHDEKEDRKMELSMKKRLQNLRHVASASRTNHNHPSSASFLVVDALVQMHGGDETYKVGRLKQKTRQRTQVSQQQLRKTGKQSVVRKAKTTKY